MTTPGPAIFWLAIAGSALASCSSDAPPGGDVDHAVELCGDAARQLGIDGDPGIAGALIGILDAQGAPVIHCPVTTTTGDLVTIEIPLVDGEPADPRIVANPTPPGS
jgi:hypothetical protein